MRSQKRLKEYSKASLCLSSGRTRSCGFSSDVDQRHQFSALAISSVTPASRSRATRRPPSSSSCERGGGGAPNGGGERGDRGCHALGERRAGLEARALDAEEDAARQRAPEA